MTPSAAQICSALATHPIKSLPLAGLRPAAVLIPIFSSAIGWQLLLTRRTEHLPHHGGEISFPGGGLEQGDADPLAAALRETEEEVGLPGVAVETLGRLDDFISIHHFHVSVYVGCFQRPEQFSIDPGEIAELIEVDLLACAEPQRWHRENWRHKGRLQPVHFLRIDGYEVWGLTAAILRQFLLRIGMLEG